MRLKGLDLNLLVALNALLIEKNVSAAGRRVGLSQSAMSSALGRLRDHFRDELLVAQGRHMAPTSFALGLATPLRRLMVDIEAMISVGAAFDPEASQRNFRINVTEYITELLMAPVAEEVAKTAPDVVLEFVQQMPVSTALEASQVDLLIAPERYLSPLHPAELLGEDPYVVVAWVGNRHFGETLSAETFFDLPHVERRITGGDLSFADAQANVLESPRRIAARTSSMSAIPKLIVGTDRLAFLHESLAKIFAAKYPLKFVAPPIDLLPFRPMIQHHITSQNDAGVQWLKGVFMRCAQKTMPSRKA